MTMQTTANTTATAQNTMHTFYADRGQDATVICPACGRMRHVPENQIASLRAGFRARCNCGHSFASRIEVRRFFRRDVALDGHLRRGNQSLDAMVEDLSLGGCGVRTVAPHSLQPGDELHLSFHLDNHQQTQIQRRCRVRSTRGRRLGLEFINRPDYDADLGFYLRG
jgi:hypothetical protein